MLGRGTMKPHAIVFRPDLGPSVGMGHAARCAAIAAALDPAEARPVFLLPRSGRLPKGSRFSVIRLRVHDQDRKEAAATSSLLKRLRPALFIADSYGFTRRYFAGLRREIPSVPVLSFDDGWKEVPDPVYGVLALGLHADSERYTRALLARSAVGAGFLPLRGAITTARRPRPAGPVRRILVTMGSGDPERQTRRVVRLLAAIPGPERIDVILGRWHGRDAETLAAARADSRVRIHRDPPDLPALMSRADLAVTAGGVTCGELACLGVPMLVLTTAANQLPAAKRLAAMGGAVLLGGHRTVSDTRIRKSIEIALKDARLRRGLSLRGRAAVDGGGAERTARFLEQTARRYHQDRFPVSAVRGEYEASAGEAEEHARVRWGSREGMLNRFRLAEAAVDWKRVGSWLDIGCGTGAFRADVSRRRSVPRTVGMDLSPSLLRQAKARPGAGRAEFVLAGLGDRVPGAPFDLVTCIGVLQKCGTPLAKAVALMAELLSPGGQLFATTKNRDWSKFRDHAFVPEPSHHWFRLAEIREAFALADLDIVRLRGFEPRTGKAGAAESFHSVFILAKK